MKQHFCIKYIVWWQPIQCLKMLLVSNSDTSFKNIIDNSIILTIDIAVLLIVQKINRKNYNQWFYSKLLYNLRIGITLIPFDCQIENTFV